MDGDRDRRTRRVFGPPSRETSEERRDVRRPAPIGPPSTRLLLAGLGLAAVLAAAAIAYMSTPTAHVASGCFWWTAKTIDRVVSGDRGCVRGYVAVGGSLADSRERAAYRMSFLLSEPDTPVDQPNCPFEPGDAVVIRAHAIFDDGRTILIVDNCR